jgi:hypothetical protein
MPAKENSGRLSSSANHTTSFFLVVAFGSYEFYFNVFILRNHFREHSPGDHGNQS